jgi:hypothetical protein
MSLFSFGDFRYLHLYSFFLIVPALTSYQVGLELILPDTTSKRVGLEKINIMRCISLMAL